MADRPVRLQLSRRKGFDLQALSLATNGLPAVNVARPSNWGNPYTDAQRQVEACDPGLLVALFRDWITKSSDAQSRRDDLPELRGKNLACWCPPGQPCHADVLLELANIDAATPPEGE